LRSALIIYLHQQTIVSVIDNCFRPICPFYLEWIFCYWFVLNMHFLFFFLLNNVNLEHFNFRIVLYISSPFHSRQISPVKLTLELLATEEISSASYDFVHRILFPLINDLWIFSWHLLFHIAYLSDRNVERKIQSEYHLHSQDLYFWTFALL
jgi:hypothetical protein